MKPGTKGAVAVNGTTVRAQFIGYDPAAPDDHIVRLLDDAGTAYLGTLLVVEHFTPEPTAYPACDYDAPGSCPIALELAPATDCPVNDAAVLECRDAAKDGAL